MPSKLRFTAVCAFAAVAAAALAPAPAAAIDKPSTTGMTCAQAQGVVTQRRAVVLSTGRDLYDRYVLFESLCATGLYARDAFVPTRDNAACHIGYYCVSMPPLR